MALTEPNAVEPADIATRAVKKNTAYQISGTKLFVSDANIADYVICAAKTGRIIKAFLVDMRSKGLKSEILPTMAGDKQCALTFDRVSVPAKNILGEAAASDASSLAVALQKAAVLKSAEMLGASEKVLEMTTAYAKERVQFEHAIGSFQAVQHHCADMLIALETARLIVYEAAWLVDKQLSYAKEASMAKAWVSESFSNISRLAHQVFGGLGLTEDSDLCLYSRRAWEWDSAFGSPDSHYIKVGQEIGVK